MKRKEILQRLHKLGFTIKEDGKHTKILKDGNKISVLSRQAEIKEIDVHKIEKQLDVTLR